MGGRDVKIPFLRPSPPRLSDLTSELRAIEQSRIFTNYGPTNARFERALEEQLLNDAGGCVTVCNATIGLMMAMRAVIERRSETAWPPPHRRRYALMPSFTFAAAAQAADWIGLTPLFCDVDLEDWSSCPEAEERLIARHGDDIAVIVPYATFGNCIDLDHYAQLSERTGIPVVIDAAASLGSLDDQGRGFGAGFGFPVVFSMHATKMFSTAEGGVIHCGDRDLIEMLRTMGNFGFGLPRSATMPGLNSKLSEIGALLALGRLGEFEAIVRHRDMLADRYRQLLPDHVFQRMRGRRCACQFMPILPPAEFEDSRDEIIAALGADGVGAAAYFSPHVAEQPFFRSRSVSDDLCVTAHLSHSILALPLWDDMTARTVEAVCEALRAVYARLRHGTARHLPLPGLAAHVAAQPIGAISVRLAEARPS